MSYRVLILADHALRDTPGLASIRVELEKLIPDIDCRIIDIHLFNQFVNGVNEKADGSFHPHVVVVNHLHDQARNNIVDTVRRRGGLCVVLPSEGRPSSSGQIEWASKKFKHSLCDLYCSWTAEFDKYLPETVDSAVTGSQRFDFYFGLLKQLTKTKEELCSIYGLDPSKPIVTVASSFPNAKFAKANSDFLESDWKKLGVSEIEGRENPVAVAREELVRFNKFQAWLLVLARERPQYQIIVKPHPAEDAKDWQQFCDGIGAKVMLTDYIYSLLAMSDVHVSRTECLTLPEAWIAEVPTVSCYFDEKLSGSIEEAESAQGIGCAGPDIFIEMVDDCITHGNGSGIFYEGREEYK